MAETKAEPSTSSCIEFPGKTWMPGTWPGMTNLELSATRFDGSFASAQERVMAQDLLA
jgi:hypothetical protein